MVVVPVNGESFVDFDVLAGFDAAAAEQALAGVVAIERIAVVDFKGLGLEGNFLVLDGQHFGGVVDGAVAVVVVADGAIEHVVFEEAVEGLALRGGGGRGIGGDDHPVFGGRGAGADEFAVGLDHAGIAGLDGTELGVIADLGEFDAGRVDDLEEQFTVAKLLRFIVKGDGAHVDLWFERSWAKNGAEFCAMAGIIVIRGKSGRDWQSTSWHGASRATRLNVVVGMHFGRRSRRN